MFCPRCGKQIAEGAAFCDNCGSSLLSPDQQPNFTIAQDLHSAMPYARSRESGSRRKGVIIALIIAAVVLAAAAIVIVMLLDAGISVTGLWYSEDSGEVIEFKADNVLYVYTYEGKHKGKYTYDRGKAKGVININGQEYAFVAGKDKVEVKNRGEYIRAGKGFDTDDFIEEAAKAIPTPEPTPEPTPRPTPEPTPTVETVLNENMTLSLKFGSVSGVYTGETVEGLPHGYGTFTSAEDFSEDGWKYEGDWVSGHMSGWGQTSWGGGYYQTGEYSDDYLNGQGSEYWSDVLYYEGGFADGLFHGQGTIYNTNGDIIYSGSWAHGFIQETPEARSARIGAFKETCVSLNCKELYEACKNEENTRVKVKGVVFDVYRYQDQGYYCDFLMYEQGKEDKGRIIQVYYHLSEGEPIFTEGQEVTVWGTAEYLYYYTAESGENLIVPLIEAWSVE